MNVRKFLAISLFIFGSLSSHAENMLLITDIHFNPYAECSEFTISCSSLQKLIESPVEKWSTILNQKTINSFREETNNAFLTQGITNLIPITNQYKTRNILITGDLLSHDFNLDYKRFAPVKYNTPAEFTKFASKTELYILTILHDKLPNSKIYMVLGNNDSDSGDYEIPSTSFLQVLSSNLSNYVTNKQDFITSYNNGGYFSTPLSDRTTLIGVNTNALSAINADIPFANKQFEWLKQELIQANKNKKKIILLQHIPYGIDLYKTATSKNPTLLLNYNLQDKYLQLLEQYAALITTIYAGHYHMEYMSIINSKIPLIGSIAFNSLFGNNPGFKIVNIDNSGNFVDYTTYYSDLTDGQINWRKLYSFSQTYGNIQRLVNLLSNFSSDLTESKVVNYRKYFNGNNSQNLQLINNDINWKYYYCGIKYMQQNDYANCIKLIQ